MAYSWSWELKQLFVCGGWSDLLGQPVLLVLWVWLSSMTEVATWHVQLCSHCLSWSGLLELLHGMSAESQEEKTE